jgi:AraC-like DNA-binding protein
MKTLIDIVHATVSEDKPLPFSVYSSQAEQFILNVPISKPVFILVLNGEKELGENAELVCRAGEFVFLSNTAGVNMRNIPQDKAYMALLIEFEQEDFEGLKSHVNHPPNYVSGRSEARLTNTLQQFIEWSAYAPEVLWTLRRRELLQLLVHLGFNDVFSLFDKPGLTHKVTELIKTRLSEDISAEGICQVIGMSESTLRRKLKGENTSIQAIKDQTKLGFGLHLLQTTRHAIGYIAAECGYQS